MKNKVYIFDTTLRDGEQAPGCQLNTVEKIEVAKALESLGVDVVEPGFPISSKGDFDSVVEITKAISKPVISPLARAIKGDIDCAAESLKYAKRKRIHTFISSSDIHIKYVFKSTREEILQRAIDAVKHAKKYVEDVQFSPMDAGRTENEFLAHFVEKVIEAGATVINIPDTTGYCMPWEFGEKIKYLVDNVKNIDKVTIAVHCHNDLGLATANALAGVVNGARQVEGTINGVGERAGNTALEEVIMAIKTNHGLDFDMGINTKKIYPTSRLVSRLMKMPVQANKAIVGANAFAHASGIHQDGMLKNKQAFEIMQPTDVGLEQTQIVLGARSGRAALNHRLQELGFTLNKEQLDALYPKFLELADSKKEVNDEDLQMLMGRAGDVQRKIQIDLVEVVCGYPLKPMASVKLKINGNEFIASKTGNGPVDASYNCVNQIIKDSDLMKKIPVLKEFLIQAVTKGSDDISRVNVQLEYGKKMHYGFGSDTDIVVAAVQAYVDGLNKLI
ncbi:2-isopropylmalate synthase [Candidatus Roizmanbacteria bacterium]|nr:MAG: 2-isopropylmalate synthase [Candidatus Roizmanbacteria bacterium]